MNLKLRMQHAGWTPDTEPVDSESDSNDFADDDLDVDETAMLSERLR